MVQMFDRLKAENEGRKAEIHGLKDVLVRETERVAGEQQQLGARGDSALGQLEQRLDTTVAECRWKPSLHTKACL